jgi:acyl-CoA thioesterase FadM
LPPPSPSPSPPYDAQLFLNLLGISTSEGEEDPVGRVTVTHPLIAGTGSNFLSSAKEGEVVVGQATPLHLGRTTQVWDAVVRNETTGRKMAAYRCTQLILY